LAYTRKYCKLITIKDIVSIDDYAAPLKTCYPHPASELSPKQTALLAMETVNVSELVERLASDEDAVRKMAVFKLQTNIGDPSFADVFIQEGGLGKLKYLTLNATGNTLAYSLTSFSRLLEVDKGWETIDEGLIERVSANFL
jgi:hypothetical protein